MNDQIFILDWLFLINSAKGTTISDLGSRKSWKKIRRPFSREKIGIGYWKDKRGFILTVNIWKKLINFRIFLALQIINGPSLKMDVSQKSKNHIYRPSLFSQKLIIIQMYILLI